MAPVVDPIQTDLNPSTPSISISSPGGHSIPLIVGRNPISPPSSLPPLPPTQVHALPTTANDATSDTESTAPSGGKVDNKDGHGHGPPQPQQQQQKSQSQTVDKTKNENKNSETNNNENNTGKKNENKKNKNKKEKSNDAGRQGQPQKPQKPPKNAPKLPLYQQIGNGMVEQLRSTPRTCYGTLDLMDRLVFTQAISSANSNSRPTEMALKPSTPRPSTPVPPSKGSPNMAGTGPGSLPGQIADLSLSNSNYNNLIASTQNSDPSLAPSRTSSDSFGSGGDRQQSSTPRSEAANRTMSSKYRKTGTIFTLDDFAAMVALEGLFSRYGRVSHMGILDKSYSFFVNQARNGALYFKVHNKVAIVGGDPLCEPTLYTPLLDEFEQYRKEFGWKLAFMGASDHFVSYALTRKWASIQFGQERVLNCLTNPILLEQSGKRLITQNKQLLSEQKGGISLGVYIPTQGENLVLQRELVGIYDDWRNNRNTNRETQAFITVYDPFSLPHLMTYIYTRGPDGVANGFAALRKIGADEGYHIDPCIATPGAPRGISDLLIFAAMALLNQAGIEYLSFGFEPLEELGSVKGMSKPIEKITRSVYRHTFTRLPITGKKAYNDKFKPDQDRGSGLHIIFPGGMPSPRYMAAMAHMANISIRKVVMNDINQKTSSLFKWPSWGSSKDKDTDRDGDEKGKNGSGGGYDDGEGDEF